MARPWHLCCARHCLVLFSFSLLLSILWYPLDVHAAPTAAGSFISSLAKLAHPQEHSLETIRSSNSPYHPSGSGHQRRDVERDVLDEPDGPDDPDNDTSTSGSSAMPLVQSAPIASTLCNSDTSQSLGPGWNGTFASNSPDGVYPSRTRSCRWTIQAPTDNNSHSPYVIAINFSAPIQLVCG